MDSFGWQFLFIWNCYLFLAKEENLLVVPHNRKTTFFSNFLTFQRVLNRNENSFPLGEKKKLHEVNKVPLLNRHVSGHVSQAWSTIYDPCLQKFTKFKTFVTANHSTSCPCCTPAFLCLTASLTLFWSHTDPEKGATAVPNIKHWFEKAILYFTLKQFLNFLDTK